MKMNEPMAGEMKKDSMTKGDVKKAADNKWLITCKAWPADAAEPAEAAITHEDATLKGQGKCSIWGTPFSNTPIYFDDVS